MSSVISAQSGEDESDGKDYAKIGFIRELWDYRELFYFLAWRDVKVRYKQTALGVLWALIQPLFAMVVFTFIFERMANISTGGMPGPIFYLSALIPWTYFSSTLTTAGLSLVSNSNLLTKIYFPRLILPASAALGGLVDFFLATAMLIGFIVYCQIPIGWNLLLWPIMIVPLILLAFGAGSYLAALNVKYRDIKYAIPFGIQLLMFMTPIIYPASVLPEDYRWLLGLNPLSGLIEAFRFALVPTQQMSWSLLGFSMASSAVIFVAGVIYFKKTERAFADIV